MRNLRSQLAIIIVVFLAAGLIIFFLADQSFFNPTYRVTITSVNVSSGGQFTNFISSYDMLTVASNNNNCGNLQGKNCITVMFSYTNNGIGFSPPDLASVGVQTEGFVVLRELYSIGTCSGFSGCQPPPCLTNSIYNGNAFGGPINLCGSYGYKQLPSGALPSGSTSEINVAIILQLPNSNYVGPLDLLIGS
ncbi:MAG: hypothetical protein ACREBS_01215 [Nitrososphaerales archaeon]